MFLTPEEVVELTHAKRRGTQVRALCVMGIEHKIRPDGTVVVLRAHVEKLFGGAPMAEKAKKITGPNWAALEEHERQLAERKKRK